MNDLRIIEQYLANLPREAMSLDGLASGFFAERLRDMLLRKAKVLAITGLSNATLYREIGAGRFPKPYRITSSAVAWRMTDIEKWMEPLEVS